MVAEEQRLVEGEQVVVAELVEGVPALEVAVAEVDDVVAHQAGEHEDQPLAGPALPQDGHDVARGPPAAAGADDGLDQGDDDEEDQSLGQPVAEHLALRVAHPDAQGGRALGRDGREQHDDGPVAPDVPEAALTLVGVRRRDVRQAGAPGGRRLGHRGVS
jgi:hypothetical protein